ncbi:cadherin-like domain-containing protein, partial [Spiribacter sp. SSL99]|uniref:cadherin-like domain-containing protein n=1 Tax=Spiribacter sp. SSL99 TaxID=1866884 RepID=UPI00190F1DDB
VTVNEDATYTLQASDFGFSDTADSDAFASVVIATLPSAGSLKLDGSAVSSGDSITVAAISSGDLTFTPAADANGSGYASFDFQVVDDGGTGNGGEDTDQSANTLTVDVTSVNDAPSGTDKTVTVNEDATYTLQASDFGFSDTADSDAFDSVVIATLPSAGSLKLDGSAVSSGDSITVAAISSGDLTFTPAADANGSGYASFDFQVVDDGGTGNGGEDTDQSANTLTVDVTSVNDAPSGTDKTVTVNEDATYTLQASDFGFSDTADSDAFDSVVIATLP